MARAILVIDDDPVVADACLKMLSGLVQHRAHLSAKLLFGAVSLGHRKEMGG